jgi:hypothetical protein
MVVEGKRAARRHARNSGANKLLLRIEKYRELALELPLAPVAVGLLDRTIEILRETPVKKRRTAGGSRRLVELGLKAKAK